MYKLIQFGRRLTLELLYCVFDIIIIIVVDVVVIIILCLWSDYYIVSGLIIIIILCLWFNNFISISHLWFNYYHYYNVVLLLYCVFGLIIIIIVCLWSDFNHYCGVIIILSLVWLLSLLLYCVFGLITIIIILSLVSLLSLLYCGVIITMCLWSDYYYYYFVSLVWLLLFLYCVFCLIIITILYLWSDYYYYHHYHYYYYCVWSDYYIVFGLMMIIITLSLVWLQLQLTSSEMFKDLAFIAVGGPSWDQQPVFQWSRSDFNATSHLGQPDLWKFSPFPFNWTAIFNGLWYCAKESKTLSAGWDFIICHAEAFLKVR